MKKCILKFSILVLFAGLALYSFSCTLVPENEVPSPSSNAKYILEELDEKGYKINTDYELDEKGFPFWKGRYSVILDEKNRTPDAIKRIKEQLSTTLRKEFKMVTNVTSEDCNCGWLLNIYIESSIQGGPLSQQVKPRLMSVSGVSNTNCDYIVYNNQEPDKQVANRYNSDLFTRLTKQKSTQTRSMVGMLDSGTDLNALAPVVVRTAEDGSDTAPRNCLTDDILGYNFIDKNNNVWDNNGHGTHIASNIAKYNNNRVGILTVKTHDKDGLGSLFSVACGTMYAADMGAKIINASWVIVHDDAVAVNDLKVAIDYAKTKNVLFVSAAGNNGLQISDKFKVFPAYFYPNTSSDDDNVIVVGALNLKRDSFVLADYSNRSAKYVDIFADGTTPNYTLAGNPNANGTSLSTGVVTALAAQIHQSNPAMSYLTLKNSILGHPLTITQASLASKVNNGRILEIALD